MVFTFRQSSPWFERTERWGTTMALARDSPSIQGDVPGPDPARAPLARRLPGGFACRGQPAGSALPGKVRGAERHCPASQSCVVHVWATCHRNQAVVNGLQWYVVRAGHHAIWEMSPAQNPDNDEAGGSCPPRPTARSDRQECWSSRPPPRGRGVFGIETSYLVTVPCHGSALLSSDDFGSSVRRRGGNQDGDATLALPASTCGGVSPSVATGSRAAGWWSSGPS